ncbi:transposase [Pedobacter glucosidilyticus]|uniref:transposase n=1 Tax=Pedobacter glucosidilyticus TaxID=1122941 RepID=UPI0026EE55AB|nr:transposase [Pedobacter glucosidilyticus]
MKFTTGKDRNQTEIFCLEQAVGQDNEVRLIDLFVSSIKMADYGFDMNFIDNGRPAYHPADLLKLFIYGYLNRIRSSRALEKECKRNIELMWLMKGLMPDHNTIANFRKDNPKAIRKIFHATVSLAKNFHLIGAKLLAGDSTKLRAQNSKKNNFSPAKLERHIAYIDERLNEYSSLLAQQATRLIALFVNTIKMSDYGFAIDFICNGRLAYYPSNFHFVLSRLQVKIGLATILT